MRKIKIAYFENSFIFSGAEVSLYALINNLDQEHIDPVIYCKFPMPHHVRYAGLPCQVLYMENKRKWWMGSDYWQSPVRGSDFIYRLIMGLKMAKKARRDGVAIVHINLLKPNAFCWMFWSHRLGMKVVAHARSDTWAWIPSSWVQKQANALICVSDFIKKRIVHRHPQAPAYTIYDPVEPMDSVQAMSKISLLERLGFQAGQRLISSVGLLSPHKGHDMAIRVFAKLAGLFPDSVLLIAGGGGATELARLKKIALDEGVLTRVSFTEKQVENMEVVYRASDLIFSLSAEGEAFGRVPFEALFCGTPCLTPAKGAAKELITDGVTGYLVDPLDINAVMTRALFILNHPIDSAHIVEQGQKHFSSKLSPRNQAKAVEEIYQHLFAH